MKNLKHLFTTATLFGLATLMLTLSGCGSDNSSETTTTSVITTTLTTTTDKIVLSNISSQTIKSDANNMSITIPAGAVFTNASSNTVTGSQPTTVDYSTSATYLTGEAATKLPAGATLAAFTNIAVGKAINVTPGLSVRLNVSPSTSDNKVTMYYFQPTNANNPQVGNWIQDQTLKVDTDKWVSFTATHLTRWAAFLTVPDKLKGVSVTPGNGQVTVSWTAPTLEIPTSYNIYYATTAGVVPGASGVHKESFVNSTTSPFTSKDITGLTNGTPYYFVVTAVNATGESVISSEKSATPDSFTAPPASPNGVVLTAGTGTVNVLWNTKLTATSYNIYYSSTPGIDSATLKSTGTKVTVAALSADPQAATQATDISGLTAGTVYSFIVTAGNSAGESGTQNTPKTATPL